VKRARPSRAASYLRLVVSSLVHLNLVVSSLVHLPVSEVAHGMERLLAPRRNLMVSMAPKPGPTSHSTRDSDRTLCVCMSARERERE
jgi:hypothetical protein